MRKRGHFDERFDLIYDAPFLWYVGIFQLKLFEVIDTFDRFALFPELIYSCVWIIKAVVAN